MLPNATTMNATSNSPTKPARRPLPPIPTGAASTSKTPDPALHSALKHPRPVHAALKGHVRFELPDDYSSVRNSAPHPHPESEPKHRHTSQPTSSFREDQRVPASRQTAHQHTHEPVYASSSVASTETLSSRAPGINPRPPHQMRNISQLSELGAEERIARLAYAHKHGRHHEPRPAPTELNPPTSLLKRAKTLIRRTSMKQATISEDGTRAGDSRLERTATAPGSAPHNTTHVARTDDESDYRHPYDYTHSLYQITHYHSTAEGKRVAHTTSHCSQPGHPTAYHPAAQYTPMPLKARKDARPEFEFRGPNMFGYDPPRKGDKKPVPVTLHEVVLPQRQGMDERRSRSRPTPVVGAIGVLPPAIVRRPALRVSMAS